MLIKLFRSARKLFRSALPGPRSRRRSVPGQYRERRGGGCAVDEVIGPVLAERLSVVFPDRLIEAGGRQHGIVRQPDHGAEERSPSRTSYSGINSGQTGGVVSFSPGIAPGQSAYFSLEE